MRTKFACHTYFLRGLRCRKRHRQIRKDKWHGRGARFYHYKRGTGILSLLAVDATGAFDLQSLIPSKRGRNSLPAVLLSFLQHVMTAS